MLTWFFYSFSLEFKIELNKVLRMTMKEMKKLFIEDIINQKHIVIIMKPRLINSLFHKELMYDNDFFIFKIHQLEMSICLLIIFFVHLIMNIYLLIKLRNFPKILNAYLILLFVY